VIRPGRWIGAGLVACVAIVAIAAPLLAPQNPYASGIDMLALPSAAHGLGTDDLGRDVLSRVIYGARASLAIGFGAALVAMVIGVPVAARWMSRPPRSSTCLSRCRVSYWR
jgi:peptide/nickel transport system permease protein